MSKVNLKDDIWIEGFSSKELSEFSKEDWRNIVEDVRIDHILYSGKTSEIFEEIAKECVIQYGLEAGTLMDDNSVVEEDIYFGYKNYASGFGVLDFETAKESIQSACSKEYCIIYKKIK